MACIFPACGGWPFPLPSAFVKDQHFWFMWIPSSFEGEGHSRGTLKSPECVCVCVCVSVCFKCSAHLAHLRSNVIHNGGWKREYVTIFVRQLWHVKGWLEMWVSAPPAASPRFTLKQCRVWTSAMPEGLVLLASPQPSLPLLFSVSLVPPEECPTCSRKVYRKKQCREIMYTWFIMFDLIDLLSHII